MKPSVVLAVERAFSIEILRGTTDRGSEGLVIGEGVLLVGVAVRDERAVRERSAGDRLDAGHRKSRSLAEILLRELPEDIAGPLGLVRQNQSGILALVVLVLVDVIAENALGDAVAIGEELGDGRGIGALLELEVEMELSGASRIADLPEDQPLADSIALVDGDGIGLHVGVPGTDVVAMIDDHAIAPRRTPSGLLDRTFGSGENRLAFVIFAGQAEVQAVLAGGENGMSPIADVGILLPATVPLLGAVLAVLGPRLGDSPVVLGVERNLEVGRDATTTTIHGLEVVLLVREVVDGIVDGLVTAAVGTLNLLARGTVGADVGVVDLRDLARRNEHDDRGHEDRTTGTHDVSLLLPLHFARASVEPSTKALSNQPN